MTTTIDRLTPFTDLTTIERRMRRFFEDAGFATSLGPAADVYEARDELVLELEVPGFDEQELDVSVSGRVLTVLGKRAEEVAEETSTLLLHERLESSFERRFTLPAEIEATKVKAEYAKGVLTIHVPKATATKPKKVAIAKR